MTNTSKTIIFFGTDDFSAVSLQELIDKGFTIGAVVTKPDSRKGRGRALSSPLVKQIAEQHGIPAWQPVKVTEIEPLVREVTQKNGESPAGVLVSYGKIIPQSIIDLFVPGIINVHPSLLPKYRGPSPIEAAILNGDTETGVTIMQLSAAMDAGPVYSQVTVQLDDTETAPQLEKDLASLGAQQLCLTLPSILGGNTTPTPQDESLATYCQLLRKEESILLPENLTAEQAERRIRAHLAFPKTRIEIAGHAVVITKAHIQSVGADNGDTTDKNPLEITCADGRILAIDELIGPSGKSMTAQAFLNGYIKK